MFGVRVRVFTHCQAVNTRMPHVRILPIPVCRVESYTKSNNATKLSSTQRLRSQQLGQKHQTYVRCLTHLVQRATEVNNRWQPISSNFTCMRTRRTVYSERKRRKKFSKVYLSSTNCRRQTKHAQSSQTPMLFIVSDFRTL